MFKLLSCVCGIESWLIMRISPQPGAAFDLFDPFDQYGFAHQSPPTELKVGESRHIRNVTVEQVAEVRFATTEELCTLASCQHVG
jgi:hypothetical protein